jgi:hypothetical protein
VNAPALGARGLVRHSGALIATDDVSFAIAPGDQTPPLRLGAPIL